MNREMLNYTSGGFLRGRTQKGPVVVAGHEEEGGTGFVLYFETRKYDRYGQDDLEVDFGVAPRKKRTGPQQGYPSEPVLRAMWRYFVNRYNQGDSGVKYSQVLPSDA